MSKLPRINLCFLILVIPVITFISRSPTPEDPSARCKYSPDAPPRQMPGSQTDADYDFAYVSDYEHDDQVYRRRICNATKHRVWFDWELTGLKGWADTGGTVSNELSYPTDPQVNDGPLKYDLKQMRTTGYEYKPISSRKIAGALNSMLSGYLLWGEKLLPVELKLNARYENGHYEYEINNLSDEPVRFSCKEFSHFWRDRQRGQFDKQFDELQRQGVMSKDANVEDLILNPHKTAKWSINVPGDTPEVRTSLLQLYSSKSSPNTERPDLAGAAAFYLPTDGSLIAGHR